MQVKILSAIEALVGVTNETLLTEMMGSVFGKLHEAQAHLATTDGNDAATIGAVERAQQNILDLCIALASRFADPAALYAVLRSLVADGSRMGVQKKAYRVLTLIVSV